MVAIQESLDVELEGAPEGAGVDSFFVLGAMAAVDER